MRRAAVLLLALLALGTTGCARRLGAAIAAAGLKEKTEFSAAEGFRFEIEYARGDAGSAEMVRASVEAAAPRLARWGKLDEPVRVLVLPDHGLLEEAINRPGYNWLRAWARYDEVYLQSPRSWSPVPARQSELDEVLLHELTHCLMYQRAASSTTWRRKYIPLWFREGMASFTARQAYRWPSLEDLARYLREHPEADPVADPEPLYRDEKDIVYGTAHHAFTFLVKRYGEPTVNGVLDAMHQGATFDDAFAQQVGIGAPAFAREFKRYVQLLAFRQRRAPAVRPPPRREENAPR